MPDHKLDGKFCLSVTILAGLIFFFSACASPPPSDASPDTSVKTPPVADLLAQAEQMYAERENLARLREGVTVLRRARGMDFKNYEVQWRLAKFNYYLGAHSAEKGERESAFREGIAAGAAAIQLHPDKPEGHFWRAANVGKQAQDRGAFQSLAAVNDVRREMETVLKLDEGYQGGSAYLVLGQIDLEMPELLGGNRQQAVEMLEKGLRFGEQNTMLRLRLAQAYLAVKRREDARQQLKILLSVTPDPNYLPEYKETMTEAQRLLKEEF